MASASDAACRAFELTRIWAGDSWKSVLIANRMVIDAARIDMTCPVLQRRHVPITQRVDVGDDVGDGLVVRQRRGDGAHLRAVGIALVGAAQSLPCSSRAA